jgi:glycosyltransferase involved in cell wall biosynthesis
LLTVGKSTEALAAAELLNSDLPRTIATVYPEKYGKYKHAITARLQFTYFQGLSQALDHHLQALDSELVTPLSQQTDIQLRTYMDNHNVGVIYADPKMMEAAMWLKETLLESGVFGEVVVCNNPHVISFARFWYFHLAEDDSNCYLDDAHPKLQKFFVSSVDKLPIGWHDNYALPVCKMDCSFILEDIQSDVEVISASSIQDGLEQAKASYKEEVCILLANFAGSKVVTRFSQGLKRNKIRLIVDDKLNLYAIYATRDVLLRVDAIDNAFICGTDSIFDPLDITSYKLQVEGVSFGIELHEFQKGTVVFYAPGLEEWHGATPYQTGIAASESSVVYLAEELSRRDYRVIVYNTVEKPVEISNVLYLPHATLPTMTHGFTAFISSRAPSILNVRRAPKQILWMHDIPQAYEITDELIVDHYVGVSGWQVAQAIEEGYPGHKLTYIPNGIHRTTFVGAPKRVEGRMAWLSCPARGLNNLHDLSQKSDLFKDVWVMYGFYNYRAMHGINNFPAFKNMCAIKHKLRQMEAKITGRVPIQVVKEFLRSCESWVYPSEFPETFCVSALEAAWAGCTCFINKNGATYETLKAALDSVFDYKVCLPTGKDHYRPSDASKWISAIDKWVPRIEEGYVAPEYDWSQVAQHWDTLLA